MKYLEKEKTFLELLEEALKHKKFVGKRETPESVKRTRISLNKGYLIQTVIKGIPHRNVSSLENTLNYFDKEKLNEYGYLEGLESNHNKVFDIDGKKSNIFEIKKNRIPEWRGYQAEAKEGEVLQNHFIFSSKEKPNIMNARKLENIMKTIQAAFNLNHQESIFTVHTDKKHLHAHIIINKFNQYQEKRYIKKPFLMAIKELYKEELNKSFGKKYTILKKKFTLEETAKKVNFKKLKKINSAYGQDGVEYYNYIQYLNDNQKGKNCKDRKRMIDSSLQLTLAKTNQQKKIDTVKKEIGKYLQYKDKSKLKKNIGEFFKEKDRTHLSSVIDYSIARKNKLLIQEQSFGNKNYSEIRFLESFLHSVKTKKINRGFLENYNTISARVHYLKTLKLDPLDENNNLKIIENFLREKGYFKNATKSKIAKKNKIFKFYQQSNHSKFIFGLNWPKAKREALFLTYLAQKITNPLVAKNILIGLEQTEKTKRNIRNKKFY